MFLIRSPRRRTGGFSMIEVLVTLVVIASGLLGLAKLQAAAVSNTQVSRVRSLVALQATSLASAMHGNREFWNTTTVPKSVTASGASTLSGISESSSNCSSTCTPAQLAALDLKTWRDVMNSHFPTYTLTVTCDGKTPNSCTINITWTEKTVAINRSTAAMASAKADELQALTLFVQP